MATIETLECELLDVYQTAQILGHAKRGMDKYYIVDQVKPLKQAMQRYTAWLDEQNVKIREAAK